MKKNSIRKNCIPALILAGVLVFAGSALAEKPSWAGGGGKGGKHEQKHKNKNKKKVIMCTRRAAKAMALT